MKLELLKVNPNNPFPAKSDEAVIELADKINRDPDFLTARPIVYDSSNDNLILGGNKRFAALQILEVKEVPDTWVFDAMTSFLIGTFKDDISCRTEFMSLIK